MPAHERELEKRPEADNLVAIYAALSGQEKMAVLERFAGAQFSVFKEDLTELAVSVLSPITAEMRKLLADTDFIDRVLRDGAERASEIAEPVMADVRRLVGFV